jgi:preprotein translocase subunit YajC
MALLFPLVLLGVMYAFLILPQRKRQRAHNELLRAIAPGDEVLTSGGIYGGVTEIDGDDLYLEIAPDI